MPAQTQITIPTELADRLTRAAQAMSVDLSAYLTYLEQCRVGRLDAKAQDAALFMCSKHGPSLRKLAQ